MTVTKNTLIGDLLANDMNTARFLFEGDALCRLPRFCYGEPGGSLRGTRSGCQRTGSKDQRLSGAEILTICGGITGISPLFIVSFYGIRFCLSSGKGRAKEVPYETYRPAGDRMKLK